jgi:hypothetical protein
MDSPWEEYLAGLDPERRKMALGWYASRPEPIRDLMRRYPPGAVLRLGSHPMHVVSYQEVEGGPPGLQVSYTDPAVDYDGAVATRFFVCGDHL